MVTLLQKCGLEDAGCLMTMYNRWRGAPAKNSDLGGVLSLAVHFRWHTSHAGGPGHTVVQDTLIVPTTLKLVKQKTVSPVHQMVSCFGLVRARET